MTTLKHSTRRFRLATVLAIVGSALMTAPASAGPIPLDTWLEFGFTEPGVAATGCDPADPAGPFCIESSGTPTTFLDAPPWTFISATIATLTVTDAFLSGDQFEILDFGVPIGLTSVPGVTPEDCGDDPVVCLGNPAMSSGVFPLAAGAHSLTLVPLLAPDGGGSGYLLVAVPEPASLMLLATGLGFSFRRWSARASRVRGTS